jgi:hypothetical protein
MSGNQSRTPKKFCSLLTYIEHNNRDLYDTIQDLCLTSIFNTRRGRSVTFLMPDPKSTFHATIINAAYGKNPSDAVDLIKACTILLHLETLDAFSNVENETLPNELKQGLEIETPGEKQVILKNGNATIIADTSFVPLYTTSRFSVFVITSGEINTDNISVPDKPKTYNTKTDKKMDTFEGAFENDYVSGGAPVTNNTEAYSTPHELVREILDYDIESRQRKRPSFLKNSDDGNVFVAMAVSFLRHMSIKDSDALKSKYIQLLHPNPMCICTMLCNSVDDNDYKTWVDTPDDANTSYMYEEYETFLNMQVKTTENIAGFIDEIANLIKKRSVSNITTNVLGLYAKRFGKDMAKSTLTHHESIFLLNSYLRCIASKDYSDAKKYADIYKHYYCAAGSTPMIISDTTLNGPLTETAVICKAFEFIRSDSFYYPNKDTRDVIDVDGEPSVDFKNGVFNYDKLISSVFR